MRITERLMGLTRLKDFGPLFSKDHLLFSLCCDQKDIAIHLADAFREFDQVEVIHGDILKLKSDALVSPGNSFGEMSGGLDRTIDNFYNGKAEKMATDRIRSDYMGELPVGCSVVLEMNTKRFPFLILAPTMRIPGIVKSSHNAYLAFRGSLVAIAKYNQHRERKIRSVAIPSMCTGVGGMDPKVSSLQMMKAFENVAIGLWEKVAHPSLAPFANQ